MHAMPRSEHAMGECAEFSMYRVLIGIMCLYFLVSTQPYSMKKNFLMSRNQESGKICPCEMKISRLSL
jgi:hypothetical protein